MAETKNTAGKAAKPQDKDQTVPGTVEQRPDDSHPGTQEDDQGLPPAPSHLTVLILRDERVGNKDYKPGDTPKLTYDEAQRLIKRGGADGDSGAIRTAQAQRKQAAQG